jgi:SH3 domain-containing protein
MRRIIGAIAGAAGFLLLVGCTHVPLLIAGMDAEDIQRVSNDDLCRSSDIFLQTRGRRFANIETEIDRRGLACGDNDDVQVAEQSSAVAPAPAPAQAAAPASETASRALQNANMRSGPGAGHAVVGSLRVGESVTVLRVVNGWCECMTGARRVVFIRCNLLAPPAGGWLRMAGGPDGDLPVLIRSMRYPEVSARMRSAGWEPMIVRRPGESCGWPRCPAPEVSYCAMGAEAPCSYHWRRGQLIAIITGGGVDLERGQGFLRVELCRSFDKARTPQCEPLQTRPVIAAVDISSPIRFSREKECSFSPEIDALFDQMRSARTPDGGITQIGISQMRRPIRIAGAWISPVVDYIDPGGHILVVRSALNFNRRVIWNGLTLVRLFFTTGDGGYELGMTFSDSPERVRRTLAALGVNLPDRTHPDLVAQHATTFDFAPEFVFIPIPPSVDLTDGYISLQPTATGGRTEFVCGGGWQSWVAQYRY